MSTLCPCRNVAVVVSEIQLPPSPVHAEVEGRRSAAASGQNSERVGDEVYVYSVSQPPRRLLVFIGSSQRFIFLSSIRLITAQLIQAEPVVHVHVRVALIASHKSRDNLRENARAACACINSLLFSHMHLFCYDRRLPYLSKATSPCLGNTGLLVCML
jgi:hypothetical protein